MAASKREYYWKIQYRLTGLEPEPYTTVVVTSKNSRVEAYKVLVQRLSEASEKVFGVPIINQGAIYKDGMPINLQ